MVTWYNVEMVMWYYGGPGSYDRKTIKRCKLKKNGTMKIIYNDIFLKHDTGNHPENNRRFTSFPDLKSVPVMDGRKYLELVHNGEFIQDVEQRCKYTSLLDHETLCSNESFTAASYAVGATIQAIEKGDFALVRPPGHHSFSGRSSGFCIFNNLAVAAQYLVNMGKKVLIFALFVSVGVGMLAGVVPALP